MIDNTKLITQIIVNSLKIIALISIMFTMVVLLLIFLQHRQLSKISLLDFPEMIELKEMAKADPSDTALKEKIRYLDLAARRNWFAGLEQLRIGGYLLFGGIIVLLSSLAFIRLLEGPAPPDLTEDSVPKIKPNQELLILSLVCGLLVVFVVVFIHYPSGGVQPPAQTLQSELPVITKQDLLANYTRFRGSMGSGAIINAKPIVNWNIETNQGIKWKTEVPLPGFSSPIVWKNLLFITGGTQYTQALFAYDAQTGQQLWKVDTENITGSPQKAPDVTSDTGYAASTPATNGRKVCAIFATGDLVCADLEGNQIWAKNLGVPDNHYGHSSSLFIVDDYLIVQCDDHQAQMLYCFDLKTGKVVWQKNRETTISWASPIFVETPDISAVIVIDSKYVQAFNLTTGDQIWSTKCLNGEVAPSPVYHDGKIFVANEMADAVALDVTTGKILWKTNESYLPSVSSPLVVEDMLFLFSYAVTCVNIDTGKILWEKDMPSEFYSSPLLLNGKIVVFNVKGTMYVIKPDRENLVIEKQVDLKEGVVATPAVVGSNMWIRGVKNLYAVEAEDK